MDFLNKPKVDKNDGNNSKRGGISDLMKRFISRADSQTQRPANLTYRTTNISLIKN